ncbi:hypothetical protein HDU81_002053 [Chytriomyces hyalinus]|nr:hypothetical protein HDU81_002053 [Chytriomyces hyalinus]
MIDGLSGRSLQRLTCAGGGQVPEQRHSSALLPNADSQAVDTQSVMSSATTHSPKTGSFEVAGEPSLVEWQESDSRSQQNQAKLGFSGSTTSNAARTEPDGSIIDGSINASEAHFQTEDSVAITHAIQTEVLREQDLWNADGRTGISVRMDEGGQEFVMQATESCGERLAKASTTEFAGIDVEKHLYPSSANAESMIAINLPHKKHSHSATAKNGGSEAGFLVDEAAPGELTLFLMASSWKGTNRTDMVSNGVTRQCDHLGAGLFGGIDELTVEYLRQTLFNTRTQRIRRLAHPITPQIVSKKTKTPSLTLQYSRLPILPFSQNCELHGVEYGRFPWIGTHERLASYDSHSTDKIFVKHWNEAQVYRMSFFPLPAPPPGDTNDDAECDEVKFERRITRLSRKHQLEASIESSAKRHRTSSATYHGRIEDALDAGIVIEACIKGILREVSGAMEVSSIAIRSGTVLVIHERDGNIQRWRDGYQWSPSRVSGGFLIYRQVERKDIPPATETEETQDNPAAADSTKLLTKAKSFTVLPDGLTKKTIGLIGSDRQSYRVISYYETEDERVRRSLINIQELNSPRSCAHKALPRPSKDETFSSLSLYPKDTDASTSNGWRNKRKRKAVVIPQIDRRYPEYEPQISDYPIMFPYRQDPAATDDAQAEPCSATENSIQPKALNKQLSSSSHLKRTSSTLAPQYSRAAAMEQYLNPNASQLAAYTSSTSTNTYHHQGNNMHYPSNAQHDAYRGLDNGFASQQQLYQQQYTLAPGYFQPPPSGYGPLRPSPSNGYYPL